MKEPNYIRSLNMLGGKMTDKIRIYFRQNRGKIEHFVVQYYALINGRWRTIMRIDTCHGYAHRHVYHLKDKEYKHSLPGDLNTLLTESQEFLTKNFEKIKENFLRAK